MWDGEGEIKSSTRVPNAREGVLVQIQNGNETASVAQQIHVKKGRKEGSNVSCERHKQPQSVCVCVCVCVCVRS